MPRHHPFQESFWSPTSSIDLVPNFHIGFNVLHSKLEQSLAENKAITEFIQQRIVVEREHAASLAKLIVPETPTPFDLDIGSSLKQCFQVVRNESTESAQEHHTRAEDLNTTVLDPLKQFSSRYERIIVQAKQTVEAQITQFQAAYKAMEQAKIFYANRCKSLLMVQPEFTMATVVKVGNTLLFGTRDQVWVWLNQFLIDNDVYTEQQMLNILKDVAHDEELLVLDDLVQLGFLEKQQDTFTKTPRDSQSIANTKGFSGFLGRWSHSKKDELAVIDMLEADKAYRTSVSKVDKMRTQTEQLLFQHYEEMESLELERIQTIKHAFISMAASLSNTIPRCKETFDNMMLYQETLKPDKDVQFIVEQYRTGQFCPRPILYENYFYGATDQLFGVPLEDITRVQESLVPQLITQGLTVIESGFSKLHDEEKNIVWIASLPLDRVHAAREEINWSKPSISIETLEKYDLLLLASLIRLYLLELPECLFTFELYEPCKLLYASQLDQDTRLTSISKLIATLPTANYHTVKRLFGHFHTVMKELNTSDTQFAITLAKSFGYILMRPQTETKVSVHERHAQKLLKDLIQHHDTIFTEASHKAQEENSNRPCIVCPVKSNSLDDTSSIQSTSSSSRASTTKRRGSILSSLMKSSQSTPTSSIRTNNSMMIPMPSSSTLFEDPDEWQSSESSSLTTPPHSTASKRSYSIDRPKKPLHEIQQDHFVMEELASLDSFFQDED